MTHPSESQSPSVAAKMIHASLIAGQLMFAGVTYFTVRPNREALTPLSQQMVMITFGAAVAACLLALFLRRNVPARSRTTSPDEFWRTASAKALIMWVPLEAAGLFALAQYFASVDPIALAAAAVPMLLLAILNPWVLERA